MRRGTSSSMATSMKTQSRFTRSPKRSQLLVLSCTLRIGTLRRRSSSKPRTVTSRPRGMRAQLRKAYSQSNHHRRRIRYPKKPRKIITNLMEKKRNLQLREEEIESLTAMPI